MYENPPLILFDPAHLNQYAQPPGFPGMMAPPSIDFAQMQQMHAQMQQMYGFQPGYMPFPPMDYNAMQAMYGFQPMNYSAPPSSYPPTSSSQLQPHSPDALFPMPPQPPTFYMAPPVPGVVAGDTEDVTQFVYIPNEVVGGLIGRGGAKINEIRTMSGAQVHASN
jgi:KH domain